MQLQDQGYGVDKDIPTILIAAASFDDIIAITIFGIFSDLAFSKVIANAEEPYESIIINAYQIITGLVIGLLVGAILGYLFQKVNHTNRVSWLKFFLILIILVFFLIGFEVSGFHESRYICVLFFGYMLNVFWEEDKPDYHLGVLWKFMGPFLFGTIGATIDLKELEYDLIPQSLVIILAGGIIRMAATYCCVWRKKFTVKERLVIV